jgi:prephenate dehydrogenase
MNLSKVAILGPGLLGGSIALAMRERLPGAQIAVWARREAAVAEVQTARIADIASTELEPVVRGANVSVLCVPIGSMTALAEKIAPLISPHALVTDVGSVKAPVVRALTPIFRERGKFIGSHPMAGSEQTGLSAARADLFENAVCILTPEPPTDSDALSRLRAFWELLGCHVRNLSPREHDDIIALVSHLPHLLAATLINTVHGENAAATAFCGNGFRDTTRVASGPPAMWAEILDQNREPLKKSVNAMIEKLREFVTLLDSGDSNDRRAVEQFLADAKTERDRLKISKAPL